MTQDKLWRNLDIAISLPDRKKAKETVVALLQKAYEEDLVFMCGATSVTENPNFCNPVFREIGNYRYFTVFTNADHFDVFYHGVNKPNFERLMISSRSILDAVFDQEDIHGIVFNPFSTPEGVGAGFTVKKQDLPFGAQRKQYPPSVWDRKNLKRICVDNTTSEEFWKKLDAAVSLPDRKKMKETIVLLLQQAYEENLALMCAAVPSSEGPSLCEQVSLNVRSRRYFILFTQIQLFNAFHVPEHPNLRLSGLRCREVLDDMFKRDDIHGLAFNPYFSDSELHTGVVVRKTDLPFGAQQENVSSEEVSDSHSQ